MGKKVLSLIAIAVLIAACNNTVKEVETTESEKSMVAEVTFANLIENPAEFMDKDISIEGQVVHVCKHSGKKMFIVGEDPDIRLFISIGEELAKVPVELEGSIVRVSGHFNKAEAGKEADAEHKSEKVEGEEGEDCATEAAVAAQPVLAEFVLNYKEHTVK